MRGLGTTPRSQDESIVSVLLSALSRMVWTKDGNSFLCSQRNRGHWILETLPQDRVKKYVGNNKMFFSVYANDDVVLLPKTHKTRVDDPLHRFVRPDDAIKRLISAGPGVDANTDYMKNPWLTNQNCELANKTYDFVDKYLPGDVEKARYTLGGNIHDYLSHLAYAAWMKEDQLVKSYDKLILPELSDYLLLTYRLVNLIVNLGCLDKHVVLRLQTVVRSMDLDAWAKELGKMVGAPACETEAIKDTLEDFVQSQKRGDPELLNSLHKRLKCALDTVGAIQSALKYNGGRYKSEGILRSILKQIHPEKSAGFDKYTYDQVKIAICMEFGFMRLVKIKDWNKFLELNSDYDNKVPLESHEIKELKAKALKDAADPPHQLATYDSKVWRMFKTHVMLFDGLVYNPYAPRLLEESMQKVLERVRQLEPGLQYLDDVMPSLYTLVPQYPSELFRNIRIDQQLLINKLFNTTEYGKILVRTMEPPYIRWYLTDRIQSSLNQSTSTCTDNEIEQN